MTPEEIDKRVEIGRRKAKALALGRQIIEEQKRNDAKSLKDMGFSTMFYRPVSFAVKYEKTTGEGAFYFTILSPKDQFSRPDARRVLLQHIEEGTHRLNFHFDFLHCLHPRDNQSDLKLYLLRRLLREAECNPRNFPRNFVKKNSTLVTDWW